MTMVLELRAPPDQRLNLAALTPHNLAGKSRREIEALNLSTTRISAPLGEWFKIKMGGAEKIRLLASSARLDNVGADLAGGRLHVEGSVGAEAGRGMSQGDLTISGNVEWLAGSAMSGGTLTIGGNAGNLLGGPRVGEMAGMSGGVLLVRGCAGERAGDRMRRGLMIIEGNAGPFTGSRMIAGTLIIAGRAGAMAGTLQKRGSLFLGSAEALSPSFVPTSPPDPVFLALLARHLAPISTSAHRLLTGGLHRYIGDMAVLGKGELFIGLG